MKKYYPEGKLFNTKENQRIISSTENLEEAKKSGIIAEAFASVCDRDHNLLVELPCIRGIIPREEGAIGIDDGSVRDVAVVSRVGKPVCFKVIGFEKNSRGNNEYAVLSRKAAQQECYRNYINELTPGDIIDARITHIEKFGCFVDIGCGIPSLIPVDSVSVSRVSSPADRFELYQDIRAVVKYITNVNNYPRITLSHKELLGTWSENSALYCAGETVTGIVRSVESYGIFIELAPNLAGLAELRDDVREGQIVSVYIKAIIPEKMKIKLVIADVSERKKVMSDIRYFISSGHIDRWRYSPENSYKSDETVF